MAGVRLGGKGRSVGAALPVSDEVTGLSRANARARLIFLAFVVIAALAGLIVTRLGVERSSTSLFLGASVDHYLDADGQAGFADIVGPLATAFVPSTGTMVNRGTEGGVNSVLWLRLKAPDLPGDPARRWVLSYQETRAREVSLFVGAAIETPREVYIQGTLDPETGRADRFAHFTVEAAAISGQDVYVRIYTRSSKRALLWLEPAEVFAASETDQMIIFGTIFGVMATLFFYLASISVALRDRTFALLATLVICYFAYVASDRAFVETIFLPGNLALSRITSYTSTFLCYAAWLAFVLSYLRVHQYAPRVARFAYGVVALCLGFALVGCIEVAFNLTLTRGFSSYFGIAALLTGFGAALWVMRFDVGRGIAFLVCWSPTIAATIARLLLDANPAGSGGLFAVHGVYGAVTFSLLSFAIVLSIDIQQREARMRRVAESNERRFAGFASAASDGFWETDADNRLTLLTGSFAGLGTAGTLPEVLDPLATPVGRQTVATLREQLANNSPFRGLEVELAADGRTVELSGEPYRQSDGSRGWRGIITDVTTRNARRQREAREQRIAAVGQLTSSVAHEVNNLLHPIVNLSRRLHDRLAADDEGRTYLRLIMDSSSRAATILSRILRSVHPQTSLAAPIPLSDACRQVGEEIVALTSGSVALEVEIDSAGGPLVQETELFQVVANLVSNAIAAAGNNGHVKLALHQLDGHFELTVSDDGPGIPPDLLTRIQDPFFTTKPAGEGTGLGLSIVRDIVAGWGGTLSVRSGAGTGTTMSIAVPAVAG